MKQLDLTDKARDLIKTLQKDQGDVILLISGGCCDGSAPLCFAASDFKTGESDLLLGHVMDVPVYVSSVLSDFFKDDHIFCLDVAEGRGGGFSLEAPYGVRFINRGEMCLSSPSE